uniref:Phosphonoacetaldehyde hydrolase n=1 Tax=viral metagenome TaxID=1070528 RepID=A0A6C0EPY8_9ZZZZ
MQRNVLRAVVLDWSGTLIDRYSLAPKHAFQRAFQLHNVHVWPEDIVADMGMRKENHFANIISRYAVVSQFETVPTKMKAQEIFQNYLQIQRELLRDPKYSELIPNVVEASNYFRKHFNLSIGVTTGYSKELVDLFINNVKEQGFIPDAMIASDEINNGTRPKPFMLYRLLEIMNSHPIKSVLKVGDTKMDIAEGHAAGCWTCGVSRYSAYMLAENHDDDPLDYMHEQSVTKLKCSDAHYVIDSVADLPWVIVDINKRLANGESP